MNNNDIVVYPIILQPEDVGFTVIIPDIKGGLTQGEDLKDALLMAQDAIGILLDDAVEYPAASDINSIKVKNGETKTLVTVDMGAYRKNILREHTSSIIKVATEYLTERLEN